MTLAEFVEMIFGFELSPQSSPAPSEAGRNRGYEI
jgi:hypothetical protein